MLVHVDFRGALLRRTAVLRKGAQAKNLEEASGVKTNHLPYPRVALLPGCVRLARSKNHHLTVTRGERSETSPRSGATNIWTGNTRGLHWDGRYLGLKLGSEYVDGSTLSQSWPLPVQPVFEGEGQHHIHGAQLERRIPEDLICSQHNNRVTSEIRRLCADLINLDASPSKGKTIRLSFKSKGSRES